jgi:hypothetical protein
MPDPVNLPRDNESLRMPSAFWARPDMVRALATWDVPAVLSAILDERRWTQHQLADVLGYSQSWVSNVLRRHQCLTLDQGREIALRFGAPLPPLTRMPGGPRSGLGGWTASSSAAAMLALGGDPQDPPASADSLAGEIAPLLFVLSADLPDSSRSALASFSKLIVRARQHGSLREREVLYEGLVQVLATWADTMKRRDLLRTLAWAASAAAASPVFPGLSLDEQERVVRALGGGHRIDDAAVGHIESVLFSAMRQDDALGPQAALDTVLAQRNLVRAVLPDCPAALRPRLLSLFANMSRFAGWLCFDLDDFDSATYFYEHARTAAHEAENTELGVLTLCNLSHMATWRGQPRVGIDHAVAAVAWATQTEDRLLSAYAAERAANAYARAGDRRACLAALDSIPAVLDDAGEQSPATSLAYWYGRGHAAGSRARCLLLLRDPPGALAAARQAVALADPSFVRIQAFGMLHLGNAYVQSQEIDEATRIIGAAAGLAARNRSARLVDSLMQSRRHLDPWRDTAAVRDLDDRLAAHGWTASSIT